MHSAALLLQLTIFLPALIGLTPQPVYIVGFVVGRFLEFMLVLQTREG